MAEDADTKIAFRISADGAVETADDFKKVADSAEKIPGAIKAVNDALAAATAGQRELKSEVDKLTASQAQNVQALSTVGEASRQASADIAAQGQAVKDTAARMAEFGSTASQAIGGLAPQAQSLQAAIDPVTKSLDGLISREKDLADIQSLSKTTPAIPTPAQATKSIRINPQTDTMEEVAANAAAVAAAQDASNAAAKAQFAALQADELAAVKTRLAAETASESQAATAKTLSEKTQFDGLETAKTEIAKAGNAARDADVYQTIKEQVANLTTQFKDLESARTAFAKSGLEDQRTDFEHALTAEAELVKKKFTDLGPTIFLARGGDASVSALAGISNEVDQLTRKLTSVKAMNDAAAQSGFLSRLSEYRAEAALLNGEQEKTANAFRSTSKAVSDSAATITTTTNSLRTQVSAGASAVQQLGYAFKELAPDVAGVQSVVDIGLRSFSGMLGVLSGGSGLAVGGLIAAVSVLGSVMSTAKKDADELAKSTLDNKAAYASYLDEIDKHRGHTSTKQIEELNEQRSAITAHQATTSNEDALQKSLLAATAAIGQYDTEITRLQKAISDNEGKMKLDISMSWSELQRQSSVVIPSLKNENEAYREQIQLLQARREVAKSYADDQKAKEAGQKELADALAAAGAQGQKATTFDFNAPEAVPKTKEKPVDEASLTLARLDANREAIVKLRDMQSAYNDKQVADALAADKLKAQNEIQAAQESIEAIKQKYESLRENQKGLVKIDLDSQASEMQQELGDAMDAVHARDAEQVAKVEEMRRSAWQESHDLFMQLEDDKASQVQLNIQKEKSDRAQVTQSLMALGTTAAQLTAKQLSEAVKGHKVQAAMILEGIGDAMVAEGVRVMFQGGAALLMGNYASGGGLLALGAAEIGVGLGLGAAGSAAQPPSATGNAASTTGNSSPIRDNQQSSNENQRGPTIIYVDMPTVVSPSAEDGLRVRQAIDQASRVYGAPV